MFFGWLTEHRRRRILEAPFSPAWDEAIAANMGHYAYLDDAEREHLQQLVQVFAAEKHWEGGGGLTVSDEVKATVSAQACLLILNLEHELYRRVDSIIVYPSTVVTRRAAPSLLSTAVGRDEVMPVLGQAMTRGPVVLVWDAVKRGGIDPRDGHNVVYHEFAHKLDMLSGAADGVPPLHDRATYDRWIDVFTREYDALQARVERGRSTFLDAYAATSPPEFFAVATEHFFEQPITMARRHRALYEVLEGFYRQDAAARERRYRTRRG